MSPFEVNFFLILILILKPRTFGNNHPPLQKTMSNIYLYATQTERLIFSLQPLSHFHNKLISQSIT